MEDIYSILTFHTVIPHLISVGLGGKGGGFVDSEVELVILPKSLSRSAFNLGGPAPNRRRDGESNDTTLDLVLIPAPSQGFRGADIP